MGTSELGQPFAPRNGAFFNTLVVYQADGGRFLYDSEGNYTELTGATTEEIRETIIEAVAGLVTDEELETAVRAIEQQIEDIKNSPDVVDIVPTHAALLAYDTTNLGDNDIIRVLVDETHDNESTYYRWDKEDSQWVYIGAIPMAANTVLYANLSETGANRHIYKDAAFTTAVSAQDILDANDKGQVILRMTTYPNPTGYTDAYLQNTYVATGDYQFLFLDERNYREYDATATTDTQFYYTKSEIQLKLSAGSNISISGNTISATNTTYSAFTGATAGAAGTAGLVPAPAAGNNKKYLAGDGTWKDTIAFLPLPSTVNTTGTTAQFIASIQALSAPTGTAYLGTVSLSDMPATLVQEEVEAFVYDNNTIYLIMRSADTAPYIWWCCSYQYAGWKAVGGEPIRTLTSADYNWPIANPNGIAPWLLPTGNYYIDAPGLPVYDDNSSTSTRKGLATLSVVGGSSTIVWYRDSDLRLINNDVATGANNYSKTLSQPPTVVQTTGSSQATVMSQKATTDAINGLITMTSTDPGEGGTLAANHFIGVYN